MIDLATAKAEIEKRKKLIEGLEAKRDGFKNRRYVLDLDLPDVPLVLGAPQPFPVVEAAVNVNKGTIFYVKSMDVVYSITGTERNTGKSVRFSVPVPRRASYIQFQYRIRDTGSDRGWDNDWIPDATLLGANRNGLIMGRGHATCSGGSQLVVKVRAQSLLSVFSLTDLGLSSVTLQSLKFSFIGVEVKHD